MVDENHETSCQILFLTSGPVDRVRTRKFNVDRIIGFKDGVPAIEYSESDLQHPKVIGSFNVINGQSDEDRLIAIEESQIAYMNRIVQEVRDTIERNRTIRQQAQLDAQRHTAVEQEATRRQQLDRFLPPPNNDPVQLPGLTVTQDEPSFDDIPGVPELKKSKKKKKDDE